MTFIVLRTEAFSHEILNASILLYLQSIVTQVHFIYTCKGAFKIAQTHGSSPCVFGLRLQPPIDID